MLVHPQMPVTRLVTMLNTDNGGKGLALEARSHQEASPCRLDTQGMVECREVPPMTPGRGYDYRLHVQVRKPGVRG